MTAPVLRRLAFPAALGALLFGACKLEAKRPVLRFALNQKTTAVDPDTGQPAIPPDVQEHIYGALAMLFGQPDAPRYMLLDDWVDDGWDPNWPQFPAGEEGMGDIDDGELDRIHAANEVAFADQLAAIRAGKYEGVRIPATDIDLREYWQSDVLDAMAQEDWEDDEEFRAAAEDMFVSWYPSMRESAELYRVQCLHCHGVSGGGDGPTSEYLNPRPRDYRQGQFKFTALKDRARPRRADLYRIIDQGATGTAMPSFRRLSPAQIHGLVDYVRLLAIRGETELYLDTLYSDDSVLSFQMVLDAYQTIWERWLSNADKVVTWDGPIPPATPEMIARGREVFNDKTTGNCASCHGVDGRGNGTSALVFDPETGAMERHEDSKMPQSAYQDDWGHEILPRDLTRGVFRGSRRPIDIYRRIYAGINGTPMPGIGDVTEGPNPPITKEDLWAVVHYVRSLSEVHHAEPAGGHASSSH